MTQSSSVVFRYVQEAGLLTVYSAVQSLMELPGIDSVQVLIRESVKRLRGYLIISEPVRQKPRHGEE